MLSSFFTRYFDRKDFQYVEMDTDSAYMALSDTSLEKIVKPELKKEFFEKYHEWFPKPYCSEHREDFLECKVNGDGVWKSECRACSDTLRKEKRTPGLFKVEFEGIGIIALNSKTYCCWNEDDSKTKVSSKGLSKRNALKKQQFASVLQTKTPVSGTNKGFIKVGEKTYTYTQKRSGLTYFYAKRQVMRDGVSTSNINL